MDIPLQVTFRDIPHTDALQEEVREKARKLQSLHQRIISCRVTLERRHRHKRNGREFNVRIDLRVPEHEIVVNHDHDEDLQVALREAFDAALRHLRNINER